MSAAAASWYKAEIPRMRVDPLDTVGAMFMASGELCYSYSMNIADRWIRAACMRLDGRGAGRAQARYRRQHRKGRKILSPSLPRVPREGLSVQRPRLASQPLP